MKCDVKKVKIGNRYIGDGEPCFISLEPGATHTGLESAKKLAKAAAEAGADAVKFQTIDTDEIMSDEGKQTMISYRTPKGKTEESVYKALKRRELSPDEWRELREYCRELGILFISAPSGPDTVDLLADIGADAIKVAKADINNTPLIEHIAKKGLPVILDAREKFQDVEEGLKICEKNGVTDIVIMHCPSGYPAEYAGIHLDVIPFIKHLFGYPVAYSDHSEGDYMNYAALGKGTNFIEKTITLDKTTDAVEHYMSLEPSELTQFISNVRNIEKAFGNPRVIFNSRVKSLHRRSILAKTDIAAGEEITYEKLAFKRPGTHIPVDRYKDIVGKKALRHIKRGAFLRTGDWNSEQ